MKTCHECGERFAAPTDKAKFCSEQCRLSYIGAVWHYCYEDGCSTRVMRRSNGWCRKHRPAVFVGEAPYHDAMNHTSNQRYARER